MAKQLLTFDMEGLEGAIVHVKKLEGLQKKRTAVLSIIRASAKPLVTKLKDAAPVSDKPHLIRSSNGKRIVKPGNLKRSFGLIRSRNRNKAEMFVGARAGKKGRRNDGFYAHMVEGGHRMPKGQKSVQKKPFIVRTVVANGSRIKAQVSKKMEELIKAQ